MSKSTDRAPKAGPSWADVKAKLSGFDRGGLLGLIQDLYGLNSTNAAFLHARLDLSGDALQPYKKAIHRWLYPDFRRREQESVAKAKAVQSEYRKAIGRPEGLLELQIYWCEVAAAFAVDYGYADEGYFNALVRQFEAAVKALASVDEPTRRQAAERLIAVYRKTDVGYSVRDEMAYLLDTADLLPGTPPQ